MDERRRGPRMSFEELWWFSRPEGEHDPARETEEVHPERREGQNGQQRQVFLRSQAREGLETVHWA